MSSFTPASESPPVASAVARAAPVPQRPTSRRSGRSSHQAIPSAPRRCRRCARPRLRRWSRRAEFGRGRPRRRRPAAAGHLRAVLGARGHGGRGDGGRASLGGRRHGGRRARSAAVGGPGGAAGVAVGPESGRRWSVPESGRRSGGGAATASGRRRGRLGCRRRCRARRGRAVGEPLPPPPGPLGEAVAVDGAPTWTMGVD